MRLALALMLALVTGGGMPTVFEVLLNAARNLDGLIEGTATADGTAETLIDRSVGAHRDDGEFEEGSLFLMTNRKQAGYTEIEAEGLGKVSGSRELYAKLLHTPVRPGSVTISDGSISQVDDGEGSLSYLSEAAEVNIAMLSGAGPWSMQSGNIVPGSLIVKATGASPARLYYDDGAGYLRSTSTGTAWATIDYDSGTVTRIAGQPSLAALSLAGYTYYVWYGEIDYETGAIALRFAQARTVTFTANYEYGYALFEPLIVPVEGFDAETGTVTFKPGALQVGTSLGDAYGLMTRRYPRWLLLQKLNECLREIADYVSASTTLISTIENDQVAVASTARVLRVLAGNADTADRAWRVITRYSRHGDVLRLLDGAPDDADTIMVETMGSVAWVTSERATISEWYSAEWLGLETAARCMRWRLQQPGADAALVTTLLNDLLRRAKDARAQLTAWRSVAVKWPEYPEQ